MRPATLRLTALPSARLQVTRRAQYHISAGLRPTPTPTKASRHVALTLPRAQIARRGFADAVPPPSGGGGGSQGGTGGMGTGTYVILAAILGLGVGGYVLLRPVAQVASTAHQTIQSVKGGAVDYSEQLSSLASSFLPPGAMTLFTAAASHSGFNGFLSSLKDKDLEGVLEEIKKRGNDDVKRIVEKVEKKVKAANGKVQDVDWKSLAEELKGELPESSQKYVNLLIGSIPSKEDYEKFVNQIKDAGEKKKKEIEAAASKVLKSVEKAKKEGKSTADAYAKGLKEAAPADIDGLISQIKDAAKSAGLPADQIESWLKTKVDDGKVDVEALVKQLESRLQTAAKFLPGEPKDLINQVKAFSPSLADLLAQALKNANVVDDKLERKK